MIKVKLILSLVKRAECNCSGIFIPSDAWEFSGIQGRPKFIRFTGHLSLYISLVQKCLNIPIDWMLSKVSFGP